MGKKFLSLKNGCLTFDVLLILVTISSSFTNEGEEMAVIKVHFANFPYTEISTHFGSLNIKNSAFQLTGESVAANNFQFLEISTEENVKKIAGTVGWGVVGGVLAGPVGVLAGALLGGNKKQVTFTLELTDGRKLMGSVDSKAYTAMVASKMKFDSLK